MHDDTQSVAMLPTLNNPHFSMQIIWRPVFQFNKLLHMGAQVSDKCNVNGVLVLHPAEQDVIAQQMVNVRQ